MQMLAARFRLTDVRFPNTHPERMIDDSSLSIVRDPSKCILCGDCVRMCNEVQHVGAIDLQTVAQIWLSHRHLIENC